MMRCTFKASAFSLKTKKKREARQYSKEPGFIKCHNVIMLNNNKYSNKETYQYCGLA